MTEVQTPTAYTELVASFDEAVVKRNEVDYCALINLSAPSIQLAKIAESGKSNENRTVNIEKTNKLIELKLNEYKMSLFSKFFLQEYDRKLVAYVPLWDSELPSDVESYSGYFILYISATQLGENIFRATILKYFGKHKMLAMRYIDAL